MLNLMIGAGLPIDESLKALADQTSSQKTKAMVLANTNFKQRSGINSAASFLLDGHSVDLSEEFVEQKPSILRSHEWETDWTSPAPRSSSAGIIRVCWQCPEETNLNQTRSRVTE